MNKAVVTRQVTFRVLLFEAIRWPDGSMHVPAGALGRAVVSWGGDRAGGVLVQWAPGVMAGVQFAEEGRRWCRVSCPPAEARVIGSGLALPVGRN